MNLDSLLSYKLFSDPKMANGDVVRTFAGGPAPLDKRNRPHVILIDNEEA